MAPEFRVYRYAEDSDAAGVYAVIYEFPRLLLRRRHISIDIVIYPVGMGGKVGQYADERHIVIERPLVVRDHAARECLCADDRAGHEFLEEVFQLPAVELMDRLPQGPRFPKDIGVVIKIIPYLGGA